MNLEEFTSPLPKPWLSIKADSIETYDLKTAELTSGSLALLDTPSVGVPDAGLSIFYATGTEFKSRLSDGSTQTFLTTASGGPFLPLTGGTMSGAIDMADEDIDNIGQANLSANGAVSTPGFGDIGLFTTGDSILRYVDAGASLHQVATSADLGAYLPLAGGTMSGAINMGAQEIGNVSAIRTSTTNVIIGTGASVTGTISAVVGDSSSSGANGGVVLGYGNSTNAAAVGSVVVGSVSQSQALLAHVIGTSQINATPNSLLVDCLDNIRSSASTCTLGTAAQPFASAYLNGSLVGTTNTCLVNDVVSNTGGAVTSGDLVQFSGTSGRLITSAGIGLAGYLPLAGGTMSGPIDMGAQEITDVSAIRTSTTNVIIGTGASVTGTISAVVGDSSSSGANGGVVIGYGNSTNAAAVGSVIVGSVSQSQALLAHVIGTSQINATPNSLLVDCLDNIRSSASTCTLGTAAQPLPGRHGEHAPCQRCRKQRWRIDGRQFAQSLRRNGQSHHRLNNRRSQRRAEHGRSCSVWRFAQLRRYGRPAPY